MAIALSLVILFGWGRFAEYMGWVKQPVVAPREQAENASAPTPAASPMPQLPAYAPTTGRELTVSTPLYEAQFHLDGAPLRSFLLKKYTQGIRPDSPLVNMVDERTARVAPLGVIVNGQLSWESGQWALRGERDSLTLQEGEKGAFTVEGRMDGFLVRRHFSFNADTYLIEEKLELVNEQDHARSALVTFTQAMDSSLATGGAYDSMRIAFDDNGKFEDENSLRTLESTGYAARGKIWWAGPMSAYFLAAVLPGNPDDASIKGRVTDNVWRVGVEETQVVIGPGESRILDVSYWSGPKVRSMLMAVSDQLAKSIDLGWFSIIAKVLLWSLDYFYALVHNWGVAIIILAIAIRIIFWPLMNIQMKSMEKMKQVQPILQNIQKKYKDNREQLNKEVMAVYKTYGVNPAAGCLPMLVQLPVFFGLYQALLNSIDLRHAAFITYLPGTDVIWLADLSVKDPLYITPILMGITMFIMQRMSPPPADPMQRKIMMFLPLIFTFVFINFPAGLVLYWLTTNILQMFQQFLVMRKYKKPAAPAQPDAQ